MPGILRILPGNLLTQGPLKKYIISLYTLLKNDRHSIEYREHIYATEFNQKLGFVNVTSISPPFYLNSSPSPPVRSHLHPYGYNNLQIHLHPTSISSTFRPMTSTSYSLVPIFILTSISLPFHLNSPSPPPHLQFHLNSSFPLPSYEKIPRYFLLKSPTHSFPLPPLPPFESLPRGYFKVEGGIGSYNP